MRSKGALVEIKTPQEQVWWYKGSFCEEVSEPPQSRGEDVKGRGVAHLI